MSRASRYAKSTAHWLAAGRPTRTDAEVARLLDICQACPLYAGGVCTHCGCRVNTADGWRNKLRRSTEECPLQYWGQDLTVIYCSANRECPAFESLILDSLQQSAVGLPVISVTHRPLEFGSNIAVGAVGISSHNVRRQLQIGCQAASTTWVATAEADFLYPPGHFRIPGRPGIYACDNIRVIWNNRGLARLKQSSDGAIIGHREHVLQQLQAFLDGYPQWIAGPAGDHPCTLTRGARRLHNSIPCVTFKTDQAMHRKCPHVQGSGMAILPHWGSVADLKRRFLGATNG